MNDSSILLTCVASGSAVLVLLAFLAGCMRVLTLLFPEPEPVAHEARLDAALTAAVVGAAAAAYPGLRVTRIVEER